MATVTRRYRWEGPNLVMLRSLTDPGATLAQTGYEVFSDVTFDDAVSDVDSVDAAMRRFGMVFDSVAMGTVPGLSLRSPDGSLWRLDVDNLGILSTLKIL